MGKNFFWRGESQYNLIKMLSAEPEKYNDAINAIKKRYCIYANRAWGRKYNLINESQLAFTKIVTF